MGGREYRGHLLGHAQWATADGHAVATILCDCRKLSIMWRTKSLIDAAVGTRLPMRQLKLLPLHQAARHVELDGVAGEVLQAQRDIIPGCALGRRSSSCCLREVRTAHPTVSIRVVVDDVSSLQLFGDHNRVTQELERGSTCMAAKLMQAGCEIATKVLSNSELRASKAAGSAAAAWRVGDADKETSESISRQGSQ